MNQYAKAEGQEMMWDAAHKIWKLANENLDILGIQWSEQRLAWPEGEVLPPFERIRTMIEMVDINAPHEWATILKGIISAVREVEEQLGPQLERGVLSSAPGALVVIQPSAPSEAEFTEFTERTRTAVSRRTQEQHVFQGGSITNETWEDSLGETANLPETMPGGDLLRERRAKAKPRKRKQPHDCFHAA